MVGSEVGDKVGLPGKYVGARVGDFEGVLLGASVGSGEGRVDGSAVGIALGSIEGRAVGEPGVTVDIRVGLLVGTGAKVGISVG